MFCTKCGNMREKNDNICQKCGMKAESSNTAQQAENSSSLSKSEIDLESVIEKVVKKVQRSPKTIVAACVEKIIELVEGIVEGVFKSLIFFFITFAFIIEYNSSGDLLHMLETFPNVINKIVTPGAEVRGGYLTQYSDKITIEKAFDNFFGNVRWTTYNEKGSA